MGSQHVNPFLASLQIAKSSPVRSPRAPEHAKINAVSEAERQSIHDDAMSGLYTRQEIADRHGRQPSTIRRWIPKNHNIRPAINRHVMDAETKIKTMRALRGGAEIKELAAEMGVTPPTVYRIEQMFTHVQDRRYKQIIRRMVSGEIYHLYKHSPRITHAEINKLHELGFITDSAKVDDSKTVFCPVDRVEDWKDRYYGTEKQWRRKVK